MKMNRKIRGWTALFLCMAFVAITFAGCGKTDYEITEVRQVFHYGDRDGAELDVYTADGTVKQYIIVPYSDSGIDLFAGEIPSEDACQTAEATLSQEEWNAIVDVVKSSDFMSLPEELPEVEAYDGSTCYIEVDTSVGSHRSGGYCAGNGSGQKHQRFYMVRSVLIDMTPK